jgi:YcaO cyclodehydratase, ATP-ad Mg2+-binding
MSNTIAPAEQVLRELQRQCPLPEGASPPQLFEQLVQIGELDVHLAGLTSEVLGASYAGSAAEVGQLPLQRAYFELIERLAIGKALHRTEDFVLASATREVLGTLPAQEVFASSSNPSRWRFARSNGVAIAQTWTEACERAAAEAIERDCILRSWYGALTLGHSPLASLPVEAAAWQGFAEHYELQVRATQWLGLWVAMGVGFGRSAQVPFIISFGARTGLEDAVAAARREFTQRLGFLFGEDLPTEEPQVAPSADFHQEYSLWSGAHAALRSWLGTSVASRDWPAPPPTPLGFVDLTPPELRDKVSVARAWWPGLVPLVFGADYPGYPAGPPHPVA